jgi:hypothetical protein
LEHNQDGCHCGHQSILKSSHKTSIGSTPPTWPSFPKKRGRGGHRFSPHISHIHAIAKLISNMMATRIAPHMNMIFFNAQDAFIKKRSIRGNFSMCGIRQGRCTSKKERKLLFNVDIKKALGSARWDYLIHLLQHFGLSK